MVRKRSQAVSASPTALVGVLGLLAALVLILPLVLVTRAEAFIYWAGGDGIGRANLDGNGVTPSFITGAGKPSFGAAGIAVDAEHVYWTGCEEPPCYSGSSPAIGRADLDGTGVDHSFISNTGRRPQGIAVDADHIYWTDSRGDDLAAVPVIARANLDGTNVERSFITMSDYQGIYERSGVAVDARHIYWTQVEAPNGATSIGRANLDGTNVEPSFIPDTFGATDVAVDAEHIYWTVSDSEWVGRANLDGSDVERTFIAPTGGPRVNGVAVDANYVYWSHYTNYPSLYGTIGRANLDGTGVDQDFLGGPYQVFTPVGLAVDPLTDTTLAGRASAKRTQRQKGKKIHVKVKIKAQESLSTKTTGKIKVNPTYELKPKRVKLAADETRTLRLKPKKKRQAKRIAAALKRGKKARAKLSVKLTDLAGNSEIEKLRVRLRR